MKVQSSFFAIPLFLAGLSVAAVTPVVNGTSDVALSLHDKPSFWSKLFARFPFPAPDKERPEPPLGESGYWVDKDKVVWIYYAEDKLADHAEHVRLHFEKYPAHDKAWGIASDKDAKQHGDDALDGVPEKSGYARDEKMPKTFNYPVGDKEVTVMYCKSQESKVEGGYVKNAKALAKSKKGSGKWRIKDNRKDKTKGKPIKAKGWDDDKKTTTSKAATATSPRGTKTPAPAKTSKAANATSPRGTKRPAPTATPKATKRPKTKREAFPEPTKASHRPKPGPKTKREAVPEAAKATPRPKPWPKTKREAVPEAGKATPRPKPWPKTKREAVPEAAKATQRPNPEPKPNSRRDAMPEPTAISVAERDAVPEYRDTFLAEREADAQLEQLLEERDAEAEAEADARWDDINGFVERDSLLMERSDLEVEGFVY